jgi:hypothetical protein
MMAVRAWEVQNFKAPAPALPPWPQPEIPAA